LVHEIARSPGVEVRHRRNLVIVVGLIGPRNGEAREVAEKLSEDEVGAILKRAETIRGLSDPKARAKALGIMKG